MDTTTATYNTLKLQHRVRIQAVNTVHPFTGICHQSASPNSQKCSLHRKENKAYDSRNVYAVE